MSSDHLKILIHALETERESLLRLIDEAVKEEEFLHAHFHFEALALINRKLQTLKNLDDELYDKKQMLMHAIKMMRKSLETRTENRMSQTMAWQIEAHEKELDKLNRTPLKASAKEDATQLKNCLEQFVKNKIKGLRIIQKVNDLVIEIRRTSAGAKLMISDIKKLQSEYVLDEEGLLKLKALGFLENNRGNKMTARLLHDKTVLADKIMMILSLIYFEVFYFKALGNEASIEILKRK